MRQDISKLLESRKNQRRSRRSRKLRYRPARFNNRGKKGKIAPSIQHKIDSHITIIKKVCNILPVENIIVETAEFDTHKLKNPNIQGVGYQHGDAMGFYNVKTAVLNRDNYTCQICDAQNTQLQVHHIQLRSQGGSDSMENLTTLCKDCHEKIHKNQLIFNKKVKSFKHASHMNIMRKKIVKILKNEFDNVFETFGYLTKFNREKLGVNKTHSNDAFIIAHNFNAQQYHIEYLFRKVRRHNRQIHKAKPRKGGIRQRNQSPHIVNGFRRYDKVMYKKIECFITGKRSSGTSN